MQTAIASHRDVRIRESEDMSQIPAAPRTTSPPHSDGVQLPTYGELLELLTMTSLVRIEELNNLGMTISSLDSTRAA